MTTELYMDLRIFEGKGRENDKRKRQHLNVKAAPLKDLKDIMKKYFG